MTFKIITQDFISAEFRRNEARLVGIPPCASIYWEISLVQLGVY